jgi:uncharacterized protein
MVSFRGLFIIALLGVGVWLFRRLQRRLTTPVRTHTAAPYEEMVRCAHCGVHLPQSRAVGNARQGYFCTEEHRLAGHADRT